MSVNGTYATPNHKISLWPLRFRRVKSAVGRIWALAITRWTYSGHFRPCLPSKPFQFINISRTFACCPTAVFRLWVPDLAAQKTNLPLSFFPLPFCLLGHYFLNDCMLSSPWGSNTAPNNAAPSTMLTQSVKCLFPLHSQNFCLLSHLSAEHAWTCLKHCGTSRCSLEGLKCVAMFCTVATVSLWTISTILFQRLVHFLNIFKGILLFPLNTHRSSVSLFIA